MQYYIDPLVSPGLGLELCKQTKLDYNLMF